MFLGLLLICLIIYSTISIGAYYVAGTVRYWATAVNKIVKVPGLMKLRGQDRPTWVLLSLACRLLVG